MRQVWKLDLASLKSVREFATKWEGEKRDLHILINNAGILSMGGESRHRHTQKLMCDASDDQRTLEMSIHHLPSP